MYSHQHSQISLFHTSIDPLCHCACFAQHCTMPTRLSVHQAIAFSPPWQQFDIAKLGRDSIRHFDGRHLNAFAVIGTYWKQRWTNDRTRTASTFGSTRSKTSRHVSTNNFSAMLLLETQKASLLTKENLNNFLRRSKDVQCDLQSSNDQFVRRMNHLKWHHRCWWFDARHCNRYPRCKALGTKRQRLLSLPITITAPKVIDNVTTSATTSRNHKIGRILNRRFEKKIQKTKILTCKDACSASWL